ncbi:MAG: type II secretion system F family protein [Nanoarchaeota archaeon]
MIDEIKKNLAVELEMTRQLIGFIEHRNSSENEKKLIEGVSASLRNRIKILNDSCKEMISSTSLAQNLLGKDIKRKIEKIEFGNESVAVKKIDKNKYLEELSISENFLKRMKRQAKEKPVAISAFKGANFYGRLSNKIFLNRSNSLVKGPFFREMIKDLDRSNMRILGTTYISMVFLTGIITFVLGIFLAFFFYFYSIGIEFPYVNASEGGFIRLLKIIWIPFSLPLLSGIVFYFYPYTEKRSAAARIDGELPFVVIHMRSISGSGVEPTQIFRIVGRSKEYPYTGNEIKKVLNQVHVYGYDLINALKNVASVTPSQKFAELLNGLGSAISSGGDLKTFFEKRAETLLLSYRIDRERFTKVAETFMDIYISVVIATPMILLLLLVMISVSGFNVRFSIGQMTFAIIAIVIFVNIIFLWLLGVRQPSY